MIPFTRAIKPAFVAPLLETIMNVLAGICTIWWTLHVAGAVLFSFEAKNNTEYPLVSMLDDHHVGLTFVSLFTLPENENQYHPAQRIFPT